ncbi:MAG: FAS1-like dehydratase domain-containing protein [Angustibacter sp.]
MVVDASFVGRSYPPTPPYEVAREKIREFAEATGPHPVFVDQRAAHEAGYPDVIAPPTFAIVIAQRCDAQLIQDPQAAIDYSRVVHGGQSFTHHRPIVAGDRLVAVLHVDVVRRVGGHDMVTTRSEISTESGEAVCTAVSTIVVRGEGA